MESFDGSSSFASFGFSPRGDGTVLMIDIFISINIALGPLQYVVSDFLNSS